MKTQQDNNVRMVALTNLEAMCSRVSSMCHRYWIEKVTRSRVWVGYNNPNEYGTEHPFFAVFPCYPSGCSEDADNPRVVLDCVRVVGAGEEYDPIQSFHMLLDCPILWRDPRDSSWLTEEEIDAKRAELVNQEQERPSEPVGVWERWGQTTRGKWLPEFTGPACIVGAVNGEVPCVVGPFADCQAALSHAENTAFDDWLILPILAPEPEPEV